MAHLLNMTLVFSVDVLKTPQPSAIRGEIGKDLAGHSSLALLLNTKTPKASEAEEFA